MTINKLRVFSIFLMLSFVSGFVNIPGPICYLKQTKNVGNLAMCKLNITDLFDKFTKPKNITYNHV